MTKENAHAIYMVERTINETTNAGQQSWEHAYLMLVNEQEGEGAHGIVEQELHYCFDPSDPTKRMHARINVKGARDTRLAQYKMARCIRGSEVDILKRWNAALNFATAVFPQNIHFGESHRNNPDAVNCRTAIRATLKAMEIEFRSEFSTNASGLNVEFPIKPMSFEPALPPFDVQALKMNNAILIMTLGRFLEQANLNHSLRSGHGLD